MRLEIRKPQLGKATFPLLLNHQFYLCEIKRDVDRGRQIKTEQSIF